MSREGAYRYLVAYDIADDKRRNKIAHRLMSYGQRIQYSVFVVDVKPARLVRLRAKLQELLVSAQDSVVICELGPLPRAADFKMDFLGARPELLGNGAIIV